MLGFDSNPNFYNLDWSYQSNFSWSAQAIGNYAHQFDEVHHLDYPQFNHQAHLSVYQSTTQVPQLAPQSSLEDKINALIQSNSQTIQELKNSTMAHSIDIQELKNSTMELKGFTQASRYHRVGRMH